MRFPLHRPWLGQEESDAIADVLASGHLVQGPQVAAFEAAVAAELGLAHGVACTSGTAALHLAMLALECGPDDEVIVPAYGFPATANAAELCGARARIADVDPEHFAVTAASVEAAATPRTSGLVVVHPFGIPAPMDELEALAAERGWWLVEDAACALGTAQEGRWGRPGNLTCLSFHPRKVATTAEGGMVLTADDGEAAALRRLRNHGIDLAGATGRWERFTSLGLNYRMSDVHAAIGRVQMGRLAAIVASRAEIAGWYRDRLAHSAFARLPAGYDGPGLSFQTVVAMLSAGVDRDRVIDGLSARGVESTVGGYLLASQPYYRTRYGWRDDALAGAWTVSRRALALPVVGGMTAADVDEIVGCLDEACEAARG